MILVIMSVSTLITTVIIYINVFSWIFFYSDVFTQNGHSNVTDEINDNENFVKRKLRKTNIDLTKGTLRRLPSHRAQQFDFRAMLKKTGRLEKELETN
jgi:nitrate reductase assembly molybdenum cofactor insertion protein NarJ